MAERSKDGMDQALGDLLHAHACLDQGFYDWACFSAQQAAEKAIKAIFQKLGAEAWGHDVFALLEHLHPLYAVPEDLMNAAAELDSAYTGARYPNTHPSGAPRRRYLRPLSERMVGYGDEIVRFCSDLLATL
jgi:HEPN domain-containing protein